jgi:hypothetical protein
MTIELQHDPYYPEVDENLRGSLERYLNHRIEAGGFLTSVLENDLTGACARADAYNIKILPKIVGYIWNHLPADSRGEDLTKLTTKE